MFFCKICNNIYNITKNPPLTSNIANIDSISLTSTEEEQSDKKPEVIKTEVSTDKQIPLQKNIYFICDYCNYYEIIPKNTIIIKKTKNSNENSNIEIDSKDMMDMPFLPHTRNYICPNNKCESLTDKSKKDAIFKRFPDSYKLKFVCVTCLTTWNS